MPLTGSRRERPRNEGILCIRDVGCVHPGFATYLTRIRSQKVRCVHSSQRPFWLRASVPRTTLVCNRFRNDPIVHPFSSHYKSTFGSEHPKLWFLLPGFTTEDDPDRRHR